MNPTIKIIVFLLGILLSVEIHCQVERIILPGELKQQTIVSEPPTLRKGFFRAGMVYSHTFIDRIFNEEKKRVGLGTTISGQSSLFMLHGLYGLTNRFELYASIPYINESIYQTVEYHWDNDIEINRWSQKGSGIGDAELGFRYVILTENETRPSVFVGVTATLPTGEKNPTNIKDEQNYDRPTGIGEFAYTFEVKARKIIYPYSLSIFGTYKLKTGGEKIIEPFGEKLPFKDGNYFSLTASAFMHLNDWIVIANDLQYGRRGDDEVNDEIMDTDSWNFITTPYLYFQIKQMRLVQAVNIPLKGYRAGADPLYILIIQYIF